MEYYAFFLKNEELIYFLALSVFLGAELISHVPAILHTPLMSGANAISGVILIGAILVVSAIPADQYLALGLGYISVTLGAINISGGFFVTDRMLRMFRSR